MLPDIKQIIVADMNVNFVKSYSRTLTFHKAVRQQI